MSSYEETFCVLQPCFVYRIPPRSSTEGYKAADWNLEAPVWQGKLAVKVRGESCFVVLEDVNTGKTFATCSVDPAKISETVEAVLDSSRYYVLRIEDEQSKRHAFIGMGFHGRDASFEFKAALQDYQRRKENERRLREEPQSVLPKLDLTLKEGETIRVNINTGGSNFSPELEDDGDMFLPPPPKGNKKISSLSNKSRTVNRVATPPTQRAAAQPSTTVVPNQNDPFGIMAPSVSAPVQQMAPVTPTPTQSFPVAQPQQFSPSMNEGRPMQAQNYPMRGNPGTGRVPLANMPPAAAGQKLQPPQDKRDPFSNLVNF